MIIVEVASKALNPYDFFSHLFGRVERLVADAGDDDGVHVHLLPELLVVRQVQRLVVQLLFDGRWGRQWRDLRGRDRK